MVPGINVMEWASMVMPALDFTSSGTLIRPEGTGLRGGETTVPSETRLGQRRRISYFLSTFVMYRAGVVRCAAAVEVSEKSTCACNPTTSVTVASSAAGATTLA